MTNESLLRQIKEIQDSKIALSLSAFCLVVLVIVASLIYKGALYLINLLPL